MATKSVLSVRINEDDAEFLARLSIDGATTPSEKLRALLANERRRREGYKSHSRVVGLTRETLAPALRAVETAERKTGSYSEVIHLVAEWLPDAFATFVTGMAGTQQGAKKVALARMESDLADLIARLAESTFRLGVTKSIRGCDPEVISKRISPLIELVDVIRASR